MVKFREYRRLIFAACGVLSILATMGASAPIARASDISVQMTESRDRVRPDQTITYTVTMTNAGPEDASGVDVGFQLPDQLVLVSMSCDLGISPDTPFCEYSSLPAGATVVSVLVARPRWAKRSTGKTVVTTATAMFEDPGVVDPDTGNNTVSVNTRLVGRWSLP